MDKHKVYIALGTNLGDKKRNIHKAVEQMEELVGTVESQSALYETEPWGFVSSNGFINAVVCCLTCLSPRQVLEVTQQIERNLGRTRKSVNGVYHDRLVDLDILLYDRLSVEESDLTIPHPLMWERDFVMKPLREIFPEVEEFVGHYPLNKTNEKILHSY
ncbi:MAG: 2-amino-4-hydroxy-6-hydroxymethyldihydropteridine diphosphokinase [Prevotellaceae bacterium]|nr:2-amino-4-hydroxy-6-hydroxymethyldihydropteridine diphosphokinase [Prevotella sp.]MDD7257320.1 2-amino-4-hydroxy-6-hydroxymethyldihydropteridine diphosphokinase [Prevotellaceae bacterium]MDY6131055.1 2-amino-4-hydroxy-6-hydroxymethyldihydropteridine diphosphokinase [Prevotella sp.]